MPHCSDPCTIVQAFAAAVQTVLRSQTSALNQLPAAVQQRRQAETHAGTTGNHEGSHSLLMPSMTVLEVVLHTRRLQVVPLTCPVLPGGSDQAQKALTCLRWAGAVFRASLATDGFPLP